MKTMKNKIEKIDIESLVEGENVRIGRAVLVIANRLNLFIAAHNDSLVEEEKGFNKYHLTPEKNLSSGISIPVTKVDNTQNWEDEFDKEFPYDTETEFCYYCSGIKDFITTLLATENERVLSQRMKEVRDMVEGLRLSGEGTKGMAGYYDRLNTINDVNITLDIVLSLLDSYSGKK